MPDGWQKPASFTSILNSMAFPLLAWMFKRDATGRRVEIEQFYRNCLSPESPPGKTVS
jgi:hypothetical protein